MDGVNGRATLNLEVSIVSAQNCQGALILEEPGIKIEECPMRVEGIRLRRGW